MRGGVDSSANGRGEPGAVRIYGIGKVRQEFGQLGKHHAERAVSVCDGDVETLIALSLLEIGCELVRPRELRDREITDYLVGHVVRTDEGTDALRFRYGRFLMPFDVVDHREEAFFRRQ